jgi:hypothetical protein
VGEAKEGAHILVDHQLGRLPSSIFGAMCVIEGHAADRMWQQLDILLAKTFSSARMPKTNCPKHGILGTSQRYKLGLSDGAGHLHQHAILLG